MAEGRTAPTDVTNRRKSSGRWSRPALVLGATLLSCGIVPATGCKTGTSFSKPTWPTFGSLPKKKDTADDLATAPPYAGDVKKPSETSKPYPTTSTPNGYVLTGTTGPAAGQIPQNPAPQTQTAVVYGTTPPPAAPTQPAPTVAAAPTPAGIGPQVGPYSGMSTDSIPPPGQPLPSIAPTTTAPVAAAMPQTAAPFQTPGQTIGQTPMPGATGAPTPAESALPGAAYSSFPAGGVGAGPTARMADARPTETPAPAQPAFGAAAVGAPATVGSRYADAAPSRFSAEGTPSPVAAPAAAPADQLLAPPPAVPASSLPPLGQPATPPVQAAPAPGLLQPGAAPVRRPDPAWRPGGTSSYRPSRTILADDQPAAGPAVRTAAFEDVEPGTARQ